jgi:RND family efflux transporter MFP subunit
MFTVYRLFILTAVLGAMAAGLGTGCTEQTAAKTTKPEKDSGKAVRAVKAVRLEYGAMERTITALGTLAARDQATISVKVPGRIASMAVDLGTPVKKGDLLAQIDKRDYELRLKQAEAALAQAKARVGLPFDAPNDKVEALGMSMVKEAQAVLEEARKNRDRLLKLSKQGIISEADVEVVQSTYEVAANKYQDALQEGNNRLAVLAQRRTEYEIAKQDLADTAIYAPFDGGIQERKASPGEYLASGTAVVTVVRTDPLRLRLEVSERDSARVRLGQEIRVTLQGDKTTRTARVDRLSPALNEENRMLIVEADLKNETGELRAGMFARGQIVVEDQSRALLVPRSALVSFAGIEKVLLVQKSKIVEKPVTTGETRESQIEVLKGVGPGELVVLEPGTLRTGDEVQVAN